MLPFEGDLAVTQGIDINSEIIQYNLRRITPALVEDIYRRMFSEPKSVGDLYWNRLRGLQ